MRFIPQDQLLEHLLCAAPAPDPVRLHPSMAGTYRTRVRQLIRGLSDAEGQEEAKEALRALVGKIVLVPVRDEVPLHRMVAPIKSLVAKKYFSGRIPYLPCTIFATACALKAGICTMLSIAATHGSTWPQARGLPHFSAHNCVPCTRSGFAPVQAKTRQFR